MKKIPHLKAAFQQLSVHIHLTERITSVTNGRDFRDRWQMERGAGGEGGGPEGWRRWCGVPASVPSAPPSRGRVLVSRSANRVCALRVRACCASRAAEIIEGEVKVEEIMTRVAQQQPLLSVLRLACLQVRACGRGGREGEVQSDPTGNRSPRVTDAITPAWGSAPRVWARRHPLHASCAYSRHARTLPNARARPPSRSPTTASSPSSSTRCAVKSCRLARARGG